MPERQRHLRLLSIVIGGSPSSAVEAAIRDGYAAPGSMLNNVRIGLPKYQLPAELLPAPAPISLLGWWKAGHSTKPKRQKPAQPHRAARGLAAQTGLRGYSTRSR